MTFLLPALWGALAYAEFYRWVDEHGNVQYGDQVPATEVESGRELLNESGQIVEKVEPAKSPEELKKLEEQRRIAKIQKDLKEKQDIYDQALLATFNSVEEIEQVRNERINLIEQSIQVSRGRLEKQELELEKLSNVRGRFLKREQQPPEWIENNERKILTQITAIQNYIAERDLEKNKLSMQFDKDIQRYKELTHFEITSQ